MKRLGIVLLSIPVGFVWLALLSSLSRLIGVPLLVGPIYVIVPLALTVWATLYHRRRKIPLFLNFSIALTVWSLLVVAALLFIAGIVLSAFT